MQPSRARSAGAGPDVSVAVTSPRAACCAAAPQPCTMGWAQRRQGGMQGGGGEPRWSRYVVVKAPTYLLLRGPPQRGPFLIGGAHTAQHSTHSHTAQRTHTQGAARTGPPPPPTFAAHTTRPNHKSAPPRHRGQCVVLLQHRRGPLCTPHNHHTASHTHTKGSASPSTHRAQCVVLLLQHRRKLALVHAVPGGGVSGGGDG